jgi:PKD repeat protein
MYFSKLPLMVYNIGGVSKLVTNILTRIAVSDELKANIFLYDSYVVKDGESPEMVSFKFYDNPQYHWVLLITNEIVNHYEQWPISSQSVVDYAKEKYGVSNIYATHHYINSDGFIVNSGAGTYPVSNLEYEINTNDAKRNINILNTNLITPFVKEFTNLIGLL